MASHSQGRTKSNPVEAGVHLWHRGWMIGKVVTSLKFISATVVQGQWSKPEKLKRNPRRPFFICAFCLMMMRQTVIISLGVNDGNEIGAANGNTFEELWMKEVVNRVDILEVEIRMLRYRVSILCVMIFVLLLLWIVKWRALEQGHRSRDCFDFTVYFDAQNDVIYFSLSDIWRFVHLIFIFFGIMYIWKLLYNMKFSAFHNQNRRQIFDQKAKHPICAIITFEENKVKDKKGVELYLLNF